MTCLDRREPLIKGQNLNFAGTFVSQVVLASLKMCNSAYFRLRAPLYRDPAEVRKVSRFGRFGLAL